jgi:hypothetical protein
MHAALGHRDRVRAISFEGGTLGFGKFISATSYHFPKLESVDLRIPYHHEPDIPATFLRGPDQSDLRLPRLRLLGVSIASVSGLLLSATALTDLTLGVTSQAYAVDFDSLFACLQGMQCLRSLDLTTPCDSRDSEFRNLTPKNTVPLSKLTIFHYSGSTIFLSNVLSRLSAPFLQDARFVLLITGLPFLYLSRTIDDVREEFRSVGVTFEYGYFSLLSSTQSGKLDRFKPSFRFNVNTYPGSINSTPSTKLAMAEELALFFPDPTIRRPVFPLRNFLRQFRSVRVLRIDPLIHEVGRFLQQDDAAGRSTFPVLEEIEVSILPVTNYSYEKRQHRRTAEALAALESFVSARERAGRLVKVTIVTL